MNRPKTRLTPSAFDGIRPEIQMEILRRIYGEPRKPLGMTRITIVCAIMWAIAAGAFYIATY